MMIKKYLSFGFEVEIPEDKDEYDLLYILTTTVADRGFKITKINFMEEEIRND